jgi:hypothetical protein
MCRESKRRIKDNRISLPRRLDIEFRDSLSILVNIVQYNITTL